MRLDVKDKITRNYYSQEKNRHMAHLLQQTQTKIKLLLIVAILKSTFLCAADILVYRGHACLQQAHLSKVSSR